jgi:hypothetical protein
MLIEQAATIRNQKQEETMKLAENIGNITENIITPHDIYIEALDDIRSPTISLMYPRVETSENHPFSHANIFEASTKWLKQLSGRFDKIQQFMVRGDIERLKLAVVQIKKMRPVTTQCAPYSFNYSTQCDPILPNATHYGSSPYVP